MPFDKILEGVKNEVVDAGLLIHEGQLLFPQLGLHRVLDLGVWWHEQTEMPLPLGGNAVRRALGPEVGRDIARTIRDSGEYGLEHREEALNYAMQFARDMETELADKFVGMYVNKWTLGYGEGGEGAGEKPEISEGSSGSRRARGRWRTDRLCGEFPDLKASARQTKGRVGARRAAAPPEEGGPRRRPREQPRQLTERRKLPARAGDRWERRQTCFHQNTVRIRIFRKDLLDVKEGEHPSEARDGERRLPLSWFSPPGPRSFARLKVALP